MCSSPPYTWKPHGYQPIPAPPPPPTPMLFAMPVLVATPCIAVPVKPFCPLNGMTVAGSETAAKGKELVTTKTTTAIKGTSTKTVTKTPSKPASSAAKAPSKAPSKVPSKAPSKAPSSAKCPCKPASSAPAKSTASKKSESSAAKTSDAVICKTVVSCTVVSKSSAATKASSKPPSAPPASAKAPSEAASDKTTASQKALKIKAITLPTPPLPGMKYIYPKHSTCLHVIPKQKVWEAPCTKNFTCKTFQVPTPITVNELVEQLLGREGDKCNGWALTEVQEKGDGEFEKGSCVEFGGDKAGGTLAAVGWTEKNGGERPPVWLVLHKV
ncbi:hypothetical protein D6C89_06520 [Aureobasidium pullulans]|nr:hypothetical protein D6C89_06520 [Aureobasidium pullulans]